MRWQAWPLILLLLGTPVSAQEMLPAPITTLPPGISTAPGQAPIFTTDQPVAARESLESNRNFPNFIGFMSNPLQNIDPRSLTQVVPLFVSSWVKTNPALPDLNGQVYGPALSVAISDRFSVGLNQGGYAVIHIESGDTRGPLRQLLLRTRGQEFGGIRDGFLNMGGFAQYTFIEDVENQFIATGGMRITVPCGSYDLFQGKGPALLSPYATVGKELGNFHVLATAGYQFPARSGDPGSELFYLNAHLDRQFFGWVYPLVEVNWTCHTNTVAIDLPTRRGIIDLGNFDTTGNVVSVAAGVNFVLIRDRLEFGGVYSRVLGPTRNSDINAMLVKMVIRY